MLTSRDLYARIDEIVDRAYLGFLFSMLGSDLLSDDQKRQVERMGLVVGTRPLIELLYILLRNRPIDGYPAHARVQHLLDQVSSTGLLPVLNDAQQATIDTGRAAMMEAIESTKAEVKKRPVLGRNLLHVRPRQPAHPAVCPACY